MEVDAASDQYHQDREGLDDPRAATAVLATIAFLQGRRGRFDQPRRVLAAAHDRAADLGVRWLVAMVACRPAGPRLTAELFACWCALAGC